MSHIIVDCEGHGPAPGLNDDRLFEFGVVELETRKSFHGVGGRPDTFTKFQEWLAQFEQPLVFISDNPAYDWQFINYYFHKFMGVNPFGHSARRIGDFYAGLARDFRAPGRHWKKLRDTPHDHHPVHDAMGNAQALAKILRVADEARRRPAGAAMVFETKLVVPGGGEFHPLCAIGELCASHGHVHGAEAEELREAIERCRDTDDEPAVRAWADDVLQRIDARDSLAFREMRKRLDEAELEEDEEDDV